MNKETKSNYKIALIGNAHLDPIWLWRWQEGCNEALQTFRSALDRLNEYPDLIFTCAAGTYYRWVEEIDPDMFAEIQQKVLRRSVKDRTPGGFRPADFFDQSAAQQPADDVFAVHTADAVDRRTGNRLCWPGWI